MNVMFCWPTIRYPYLCRVTPRPKTRCSRELLATSHLGGDFRAHLNHIVALHLTYSKGQRLCALFPIKNLPTTLVKSHICFHQHHSAADSSPVGSRKLSPKLIQPPEHQHCASSPTQHFKNEAIPSSISRLLPPMPLIYPQIIHHIATLTRSPRRPHRAPAQTHPGLPHTYALPPPHNDPLRSPLRTPDINASHHPPTSHRAPAGPPPRVLPHPDTAVPARARRGGSGSLAGGAVCAARVGGRGGAVSGEGVEVRLSGGAV